MSESTEPETNPLFSKLSNSTFENTKFGEEYMQLVMNRFSSTSVGSGTENLTAEQVKRLLETAALFALSNNENHRKLALKIPFFLLDLYRSQYNVIPFIAELVLARMGDIPTIETMVKKDREPDYFSFVKDDSDKGDVADDTSVDLLSYVKFPEILIKKTTNQITIGRERWHFTDFQTSVFEDLTAGFNITFTAPTSAGKSFVVHQYIAHRLLNSKAYCAVYIVPTKSLIAEIHREITQNLRKLGLKSRDAMVFNSADHGNIDQINLIPKKVLVLTQERLLQLVSSKLNIHVDLLVVDEAQKISDEKRGVIIEDSVQELIKQIPAVQKVIISPNIADPQRFIRIFNIEDEVISHHTTKTPVGQNLFFVDFANREVKISIFL
ncbi:MAG: DEAD/DEAH box helicase, partial [Nitrososphaerales archaeon]